MGQGCPRSGRGGGTEAAAVEKGKKKNEREMADRQGGGTSTLTSHVRVPWEQIHGGVAEEVTRCS